MRPVSPKSALKLIEEIYECVGRDTSFWQKVYVKLTRILRSGPGTLHLFNPSTGTFEPLANTNVPEFKQDFREIYADLVPFQKELFSLSEGEILVRSKVFSDRRWENSKLWRDHFVHLGIYHLMHQNLIDGGNIRAGVTFTRAKDKPDFNRADIAQYQQFVPHLQRALRLHIDSIKLRSRVQVFEDAWNRSPNGIILIDENCLIVFNNKAASKLIERGPLKIDRDNSLACQDRRETERFRALIQELLSPAADTNGSGRLYTVRSSDDKNQMSLLIATYLNTYGTDHPVEKLAVIMVGDPHGKHEGPEHDLSAAYGLTPSESRIALLLAEGHSLKEISERLKIAPNTTRTHLKRVFSKTETSRQAELVKLILNTPRFVSEEKSKGTPNG